MVRRKLFEKLVAHLPKKEFSIITGARQTGKSTILKQLDEYCKKEGTPTIFINLENKPILTELNKNPLNILAYLPNPQKRTIAFVDEVQYLDDPSNFLKLLYDEHSEQIKIIATGSSAFYMDNRFKDSLAGRKRIFKLTTCSFDEYLELRGKPQLLNEKNRICNNKDVKSTQLDYLRLEWEDYLIYGGYPAIITEPDKSEKINRLLEIRDSFVKRDILESGIINETTFYQLFRILASQTGSLVNINELSSTLRIKNETVNKYLLIMQKCFHIKLVRPFYKNLRKELVKMPKVYLLDTGMRNCLLNNFSSLEIRPDKGELWENSYYLNLAEKYNDDSIMFWRTSAGNEVDFVLPDISNPKAIEIKYSERQIKQNKYRIFKEAYPDIPLQFVWHSPFEENFFRRLEI